ncbi:M13 family metallopeptidase [Companilactobacillus ginsenosidimutans]|uniref:M13 family metallopeptidase n=1 Tax=Companilactobacillus ginsenosidimutans TaxID=1007676 RepID=UPI00065F7C59|nr:M13 family metallopeptidase [Companilactobacillus ginsenosidimutans]
MKLNKNLIGVFTFSAVILGAITTTQTAKADTVSDSQQTSTVSSASTATTTSASIATPTSTSSLTSSAQSAVTAPVRVENSTSNIIYNALPTATGTTTAPSSDPGTQTGSEYPSGSEYPTGSQSSTPVYTQTGDSSISDSTNTNGGDWNGDVVYSRPQDNFYMYENGSWVNDTDVNDATPEQGTFNTVTGNIANQVEQDFINFSNGDDDSPDNAMNEATWYYQLTSNDDLSNVGVITPDLSNEVNSILDLKNIQGVNQAFTNMIGKDQPTPFSIIINRDQNDPTKNALYFFGAQPLMLTDQGIGSDQENAVVNFLQSAGYSDDEIQDIITGTVNYDQLLMNLESAQDLAADPNAAANYTQMNFQDLANMSNYINFNGIADTLTGTIPDYVYEMTPSYFNNIAKLINPSTFNDLKGWLVSDLILYRAGELQNITSGFQDFLQETSPSLSQQYLEDPDNLSPQLQQAAAYYLTQSAFTDAFSQYYGPQIVTPQVEAAVTKMTKQIIYSYSQQIINSTWLDTATKRNALGKLSRLKINIGYPSSTDFDYYNRVDIEGNNSAYVNYRNLVGAQALQNFADFKNPVDRNAWTQGDSALVPDASYDRLTNSITINAGIMQSPFFSLSNTASENLGGLGVIIGHELTHGFDATGSLYDGNGELNDWWSSADRARFNQMVDNMAAEFNGIPYGGGSVNGVQTEDENIADNGGLNVALATLEQDDPGYNLQQFFENYAYGWRSKYTSDLQADQLQDVHTPDSIRVNTSLQNIQAFYDAFDVKPGDGMYLAPDQRVNIW